MSEENYFIDISSINNYYQRQFHILEVWLEY